MCEFNNLIWEGQSTRTGPRQTMPVFQMTDTHLEHAIEATKRYAERAEQEATDRVRRGGFFRGFPPRFFSDPEFRSMSQRGSFEEWMFDQDRFGPRRSRSPDVHWLDMPADIGDLIKKSKRWWTWHHRLKEVKRWREQNAEVHVKLGTVQEDTGSQLAPYPVPDNGRDGPAVPPDSGQRRLAGSRKRAENKVGYDHRPQDRGQ